MKQVQPPHTFVKKGRRYSTGQIAGGGGPPGPVVLYSEDFTDTGLNDWVSFGDNDTTLNRDTVTSHSAPASLNMTMGSLTGSYISASPLFDLQGSASVDVSAWFVGTDVSPYDITLAVGWCDSLGNFLNTTTVGSANVDTWTEVFANGLTPEPGATHAIVYVGTADEIPGDPPLNIDDVLVTGTP